MRQYTNVYHTHITKGDKNMSKITINYLSFEKDILKGSQAELAGWWNVATDYLSIAKKNDGFTVKQYSELAGAVAQDYAAASIAQNIGHIQWAMKQGWKMTKGVVRDGTNTPVKSMFHLRKTKNPKQGNSVKPAKRSAYDDVFSQAKHLSKESRIRLIAELSKTL